MEIKKLWELPILYPGIEDGIKISSNNGGVEITLILRCRLESNKIKTIEIKFKSVLCHMYISENFVSELFGSHNTLVSFENSEWLKNLKKHNSRDFDFWKPKHFIISFESDGQYQFIAKGFSVDEKEED